MICNFASENNLEDLNADICIVGSGPVGISVAKSFLNSKFHVVLLEAGKKTADAKTQELYRTKDLGIAHKNFEGRIRIYGGTSTKWAAQASPFDPIDFEHRDWVAHSGWPIQLADISPYFREVESLMQVEHRSYNREDWPKSGVDFPEIDESELRFHYSQFSPQPNFVSAYGQELKKAENIRVVLSANVTHLDLHQDAKHLSAVSYQSLNGKKGQIKAKYVLLCCGGIETPRLMLASHNVMSAGVGNQNDLVGRFFQDHIHMHAAQVWPKNKKDFLNLFLTFYGREVRFCPKLVLTQETQRKNQVLNVAGDFYFRNDFNESLQTAKALVKFSKRDKLSNFPGGLTPALIKVAQGLPSLVPIAIKYFLLNKAAVDESGPLHLGIQAEQEPNPHSRVQLTQEKDALGVPVASVDWRLSNLDKKSIDFYIGTVDKEFQRLGLATVDKDSIALSKGGPFAYDVFDSNHHMGTTRMADDPKKGVVDSYGKVHGIHNLYVMGTAILPTGGFSNPTFNAMALALRSCEKIKQELA